jgi:hypothetical protein
VLTHLWKTFRLLAVEQVGMVAHLSKLDQNVLVIGHGVSFLDALLL